MTFEAQGKEKNEMLDIMNEDWISLLLICFIQVVVISPAKVWSNLFRVTECCNLFPLIRVTPIYMRGLNNTKV